MDENTRQATRQWTLVQPLVSAMVASVVRNFQDRDDLLQEIAVAVLESYERYDSHRPFQAWVVGIARNQIGNYLRERRSDRLVFDDATIASLAAAFACINEGESRRMNYLTNCVEALEGRARQICQMRYHRDLKPASIAALVGMTPNGVAKALQRIREELRACIRRLEGTEEVVQ